jgi:hypothetical protein
MYGLPFIILGRGEPCPYGLPAMIQFDFSKNGLVVMGANGDEIRASLGIIVFFQADGTSMVGIGGLMVGRVHGEKNLYRYRKMDAWIRAYGHMPLPPPSSRRSSSVTCLNSDS